MVRPGWALVLLLILPHAAGQQEMVPLQVALEGLEDGLDAALRDAQHRLSAQEAQERLAQVRDYVDGFAHLPAGRAALARQEVREAYAWTEEVARLFMAVPDPLVATEEAGSACQAYGAGIDAARGREAVSNGTASGRGVATLRLELEGLLERAPAGLDVTRIRASLSQLLAWESGRATPALTCLQDLREALGIPAALEAVATPRTAYPFSVVRILGSTPDAAVRVRAPSLGVDVEAGAKDLGFAIAFAVPGDAPLGRHTVHVSSGPSSLDLDLDVRRAPATLSLGAPRSLAPGDFTATAHLRTPAGVRALEGLDLEFTWMGNVSVAPMDGGHASHPLRASALGSWDLRVRFAGSHAVEAAEARVAIEVAAPAAPPAPPVAQGDGFPVAAAAAWATVLVAFLVGAFALMRRSRGPGAPPAPQADDAGPEPRLEDAARFADAVALLVTWLRRVGALPPGRTVREWVRIVGGPPAAASTFERVRYGREPEPPAATARGKAWLRQVWARWGK